MSLLFQYDTMLSIVKQSVLEHMHNASYHRLFLKIDDLSMLIYKLEIGMPNNQLSQ